MACCQMVANQHLNWRLQFKVTAVKRIEGMKSIICGTWLTAISAFIFSSVIWWGKSIRMFRQSVTQCMSSRLSREKSYLNLEQRYIIKFLISPFIRICWCASKIANSHCMTISDRIVTRHCKCILGVMDRTCWTMGFRIEAVILKKSFSSHVI